LANVETVDLWGAGQTGKPWLRWLQSAGVSVRRIFEVSPRKIGHRIHGSPVIDYQEMPPADTVPLIIAVGADGARKMIEDHIVERGYVSGVNAWFVA